MAHNQIGTEDLRVLMAPMNLAMMPVLLTEELQRRGYKANHIHYSYGQPHPFGFRMDRLVNLHSYGGRIPGMTEVLMECLEDDYNLYHFWNKSLFFNFDFTAMSGMDLPIIKARGNRIAYRFSGFDLRLPSDDVKVNPYSPFNYGYEYPYDETLVRKYHNFIREYVDGFIVQDPELGQFMPNAHVVPRSLDLEEWPYIGPVNRTRPLVVHAPTNPIVKGTPHVLQAVEDLRNEGLEFDFELIEKMTQQEARAIYERADIIVDQLLIGATGVLTLEGWALGKAVVVNVRPDLFNDFYDTDDLPVIQANPDTIVGALRTAIQDADLRADLGPRGRALVEDYHNVSHVTDTLLDVYGKIMGNPPTRPTGMGDVAYLKHHATHEAYQGSRIRNLGNQFTKVKREKAVLTRKHKATAAKLRDQNTAEAETISNFAPKRAASFAWNNPPNAYFPQQREAATSLWNRSVSNLRMTRRFTDAILDHTVTTPIDLVISHDVWGMWAGNELRERDGAAVVGDMVEVPLLAERSGVFLRSIPPASRMYIDRYVSNALKQADRIFTVSPSLADKIGAQSGQDVHLLRNFRSVSPPRDEETLRKMAKLNDAHRIIAFINTVAEGYGAEEAASALKHLDPRWQLVFLGRFATPYYRKQFEAHLTREGLRDRVHILDESLEYHEFTKVLSGADVGLIGTSSDLMNLQMAFPNRVTDYLSAGVPVVARGMHDVDRFVDEAGIGEVIPNFDPETVAAAFTRLGDPTTSGDVRNNIREAQQRYNWSEESASFISFCDEIARVRLEGTGRTRPRTLIAARKMAATNGRIARMAQSLVEAGHDVFVAARDLPELGNDVTVLDTKKGIR